MFLIFMFIFFISAFLLLMYGAIKRRKVTVPFFLLLFLGTYCFFNVAKDVLDELDLGSKTSFNQLDDDIFEIDD
ncbi:hypothetical protein [Enterococcus hirae]|uniref:hypothetical protein n=1 Tax=Enterococcus hirae TaxID=1354 RepID=UPI0019EDFEBF|nr:hypothetical protein [Enterococcus hirae]MBO1087724.1 hypothetical protein [Enterococcus hirae]MBS6191425.1 hypothetical protein [Enterococcus hirae]MEB7517470.1 hypothetical protein [Enterococcus hirae]